MPKFIDLAGKTFNRLTVIERAENKRRRVHWKCKCSCGNIVIIDRCHLVTGNTKSCGCLKKESIVKRFTKHAMCDSLEYCIWKEMIKRCNNQNHKEYKNYGGRGIKVCEEWRNDFIKFFNYMGKKPSPKHSIDRIDNDGDYKPGNCRWATPSEQSNNKRSNNKITLHGITMNISQWADFVGIQYDTLWARIRYGWPPAKAIFQPVHKRNK